MLVAKVLTIVLIGGGLLSGSLGEFPKAIPLEPGRVYQTGSPLSQPGGLGLLAGFIGRGGGGYEVWNGPYVDPHANAWEVNGSWAPATEAQHRQQRSNPYMTLEQAKRASEAAMGNATTNEPRATIPDCDGQLYVSYVPDSELGARAIYTCEVN